MGRLVLEAYGTHMEIHMKSYFHVLCYKLRSGTIWKSYGSHMEVPNKKNVTRLVLEAYGTHMEIHMEIIFLNFLSLTSIWNHMEAIWKSYGSPKQEKMLLGSFW